jgi:hypothetical protein
MDHGVPIEKQVRSDLTKIVFTAKDVPIIGCSLASFLKLAEAQPGLHLTWTTASQSKSR